MYNDNNFLKASEKTIQEICEPLKFLRVKYFSYYQINVNSSIATLSTNAKLIHFVREKKLFQSLQGVSNFLTNQILFSDDFSIDSPIYVNSILPIKIHFDLEHFVTIIIPSHNYIEIYSFATSPSNTNFRHDIIANLPFIENFLLYFKNKARNLIDESLKKNVCVTQLPVFEYLQDIANLVDNIVDIHEWIKVLNQINSNVNFLKSHEIKPKKIFLNKPFEHIYLTNRESDVALLLIQGDTMKCIAKKLNLSWTTVRSHIENLREKFQCGSKSELINTFINYNISQQLVYHCNYKPYASTQMKSFIKNILKKLTPVTN